MSLFSSSRHSTDGNSTRRFDPFLPLTLLLCLFSIGPLLQPGYFWGAHDAKNSIYFLFEFDKSIADGILWPRWGPDWGFGYGYPFWNIYGPLAYFVGEAFLLLGFDYVTAIKLVFALSFLGSALAMYLFVRRLLGSRAGMVAALLFVYAPYHLFDVYVRAALAESFSFVFIPLVFWAFFELVDRPRFWALVGAALAFAGLILSSNVLLLIITPPLALIVALLLVPAVREARQTQDKTHRLPDLIRTTAGRVVPLGLAMALALGLLAIFLVPAVLERRFVRLDQWFGGRYTFGQDFVYFFQLFSPKWGFGASIAGPNDDAGFQLGLVPVVLFFFSLFFAGRVRRPVVRWLLRGWQVITLATVYLMTPASAWLWNAFPILQSVQFPWRLGVVAATGLAIVGGVVVSNGVWPPADERPSAQPPRAPGDEDQVAVRRTLASLLLAVLILLGSYPYLVAQVREPNVNEGPVSLAALFRYQQASDEMTGTTAWARRIPVWSPLAEQVVEGGSIDTKVNYSDAMSDQKLAVHSVEMDSVHELVWVYAADDQQEVTFMTAFYPGWKAYVYEDKGQAAGDLKARVGEPVATPEIQTTYYEGWIVVPVPPGEHFLEVRFENTPLRSISTGISLFLLGLIIVAAIARRWIKPRPADSKD